MASLSQLLTGKNPNRAAEPYLQQIPGQAKQAYQPYIQQGADARGRVSSSYDQMLDDPYSWLDDIYQHYTPSAGYQRQKEQLEQEMRNTAAAGGYASTPFHEKQQAELVKSLLDSDFGNYRDSIMGIQDRGLRGYEGFEQRGYESDMGLADILINALQQRGGMAFSGANAKNQNRSDLLRSGAQAVGAYAGGR